MMEVLKYDRECHECLLWLDKHPREEWPRELDLTPAEVKNGIEFEEELLNLERMDAGLVALRDQIAAGEAEYPELVRLRLASPRERAEMDRLKWVPGDDQLEPIDLAPGRCQARTWRSKDMPRCTKLGQRWRTGGEDYTVTLCGTHTAKYKRRDGRGDPLVFVWE